MSTISSDIFGITKNGETVIRFTMRNSNGVVIKVLNYGGTITEIWVPDKDDKLEDVTLGFDTISEYEEKSPYFGAICGRVANLIAGAQFTLDGNTYKLFENRPSVASCHGGKIGFDKKMWQAEVKENKLVLTYVSPDGEENYPGELTTSVTYCLDDNNALTLEYKATTTKPTIVNLTNHAYFNLGGHGDGGLDAHRLMVCSGKYLAIDKDYLPTGEIQDVSGGICDFRKPVNINTQHLKSIHDGLGYFNCFPLDNAGKLKMAARMEHPSSGRFLECHTTEPGVSFYTSGYMATMSGKCGASYKQFCAFSLEAQHYPDSIHHINFPSTVLRPGETFYQTTIYKFGKM